MKAKLLLLAVFLVSFSHSLPAYQENTFGTIKKQVIVEVIPFLNTLNDSFKTAASQYSINHMKPLFEQATLSHGLTEALLNLLACSSNCGIEATPILTVIDYSLPSSEKRLWVFNLQEKKLLFHTYVSHGIKTGKLASNYFSNKYNSRASSLGVYRTEKTYYGREGLSLRLQGLDKGFNDHASSRAIVMHGGWYMDEGFIKKYGRAGRSWGCPAIPLTLRSPVINTIKENSLLIVYFPSERWFSESKFLNCPLSNNPKHQESITNTLPLTTPEDENREDLVYIDTKPSNQYLESKPLVVMSAENYQTIYQTKPPVHRMLRRQIDKTEYIALSSLELKQLISDSLSNSENHKNLEALRFVTPTIKMRGGYYSTVMRFTTFGEIQEIKPISPVLNTGSTNLGQEYMVYFKEKAPFYLNTTKQFIRWVGL